MKKNELSGPVYEDLIHLKSMYSRYQNYAHWLKAAARAVEPESAPVRSHELEADARARASCAGTGAVARAGRRPGARAGRSARHREPAASPGAAARYLRLARRASASATCTRRRRRGENFFTLAWLRRSCRASCAALPPAPRGRGARARCWNLGREPRGAPAWLRASSCACCRAARPRSTRSRRWSSDVVASALDAARPRSSANAVQPRLGRTSPREDRALPARRDALRRARPCCASTTGTAHRPRRAGTRRRMGVWLTDAAAARSGRWAAARRPRECRASSRSRAR